MPTPTAARAVTVNPLGDTAEAQPTPGEAVRSPVADVEMDETGRIHGIDGMLSQIAAAIAREAAPVIRTEILPVLQRDRVSQRTIGAAAGLAAAKKLAPYAFFTTLALAVIAGVQVVRLVDHRKRKALAASAEEAAEQAAEEAVVANPPAKATKKKAA